MAGGIGRRWKLPTTPNLAESACSTYFLEHRPLAPGAVRPTAGVTRRPGGAAVSATAGGGAVQRKLDLEGIQIRSGHNDRLTRLAVPEPISPRLLLAGLLRLLPQGPSMQLCVSGERLPVALEGDYRRVLQAYRSAIPTRGSGQPQLVSLKGLISQHPATQPGQGSRRTLVVEAFRESPSWPRLRAASNSVYPMASDQNPATAHRAQPTLRGTAWKLQALQEPISPNPDQSAGPATGTAVGQRRQAIQRQQCLQSAGGRLTAGRRSAALLATGEHQNGLRCGYDGL